MTGKIVCSHCSSLISGDLKTCPHCGAPVEIPVVIKTEETKFTQPVQTAPDPVIPPEAVESVNSIKSSIFDTIRKSRKLLFIALAVILIVFVCFCGTGIYLISLLQNSQ